MTDNTLFEHGNYYIPDRFKPVQKDQKKFRTTPHQKKVMEIILRGGSIGRIGGMKYRVWDKKRRPLHRLSASGFLRIKKYLRLTDRGYVISGAKILALRKNTWVKREYIKRRPKSEKNG